MAGDARNRFPVVLTIVAAVAFAILCGLGTWQLQRLQWKRGVIERIAAAQAAPQRPLEEVLAAAARNEDVEFARVRVSCLPNDRRPPRVMLYGMIAGRPVWRPISPCRIGGYYGVIAIDRGAAAGEHVNPPVLDLPAPVHVEGVLRSAEPRAATQRFAPEAPSDPATSGYHDRWSALLAVALASEARAPAYMLVAERESPAVPGVRPAPLPTEISNRHLEYVITWFGLAAALAGVYAAMLVKRLKR